MTCQTLSARTLRIATFAAAVSLSAVSTRAEPSGPDPVLWKFYAHCSGTAETRVLNAGEVLQCLQAYNAMKLSFLNGQERRALSGATLTERAAIMTQAYAAFVAWRAEQSVTIKSW